MSNAPTGFSDHFSGHAGGYAEARPGYPDALFDWLAAQCSGRGLAWDAGCGNGQASVALGDRFDAVLASDPSAQQLASATPHPRVRYAVEPAEHCSLPDASADLVTVAQAYHWFAHDAFCIEARRVLKPGGMIALWTYAESVVSPDVDAVFDYLNNTLVMPDWPPEREHVITRYRDLPFPFARVDAPAFAMHCDWTLSQYLAYLRSWSASQRHRKRTGRDPVAEIAPAMTQAWGGPAQRRAVCWPLSLLAGNKKGSE